MSQAVSENILKNILKQLEEKSYAYFKNSRLNIRIVKVNINTPVYLACGEYYDVSEGWKDFMRVFFDIDNLVWFINSL